MWISQEYSKNDFYDMLNLTKENYGDIEISSEEFLRWQYENNPAGNAVINLAKDKDILAGQYVVIPMDLKVEDKVVKGTLSLNTLTKNEYRGQGIFTKLASNVYDNCAKNDIAFTYGFPNQNSYPGFIKKLRFKDLGSVPLMLRPLNLRKLANKRINKYLSSFIPKKSYFYKTKSYEMSDFVVYEIDNSNVVDMDNFWNDIKNNYKVIGVRDSKYIKWRYLDIPLRKYKILAIKNNNKMLGYIVGNCKEVEEINSGMIVDFLINSNNPEVGNILVNSMVEYFKSQDIDLIGALMLQHTKEFSILRKNKFYKCPKFLEPQPFPVIYRAHTLEGENTSLTSIENWFITMGDYDVI